MNLIFKIKKAISQGKFWMNVMSKVHKVIPMYYVVDQEVIQKNRISNNYTKYKKIYNNLLMRDNDITLNGSKPKIIWTCWLQGIDKSPELVKACIESMNECFKEYKVIIITLENIDQYIQFPEFINSKYKNGRITNTHLSDLIRTELLCKYGGIWIDSTVLCTKKYVPEYIKSSDFFVFRQFDLLGLDEQPIVASSWIISSKSNNSILLKTRELLYEYWKNNNSLKEYFLFHIFFSMSSSVYPEIWSHVPVLDNVTPHLLQRKMTDQFNLREWKSLKEKSDFYKLNNHMNYSKCKDTFYNFIIND